MDDTERDVGSDEIDRLRSTGQGAERVSDELLDQAIGAAAFMDKQSMGVKPWRWEKVLKHLKDVRDERRDAPTGWRPRMSTNTRRLGHFKIRCQSCDKWKHVSGFPFRVEGIGRDDVCRRCYDSLEAEDE